MAFITILCLSTLISTNAFQWQQWRRRTIPVTSVISHTGLNAENNDKDRRNFLSTGGGALALVLLGGTATINQPAEASYTAYSRREEDWKERMDKGGEI